MPRAKCDLTGQKFGKWTVLGEAPTRIYGARKAHRRFWSCRCDCGTEREVLQSSLTNGNSTGCGCKKLLDLTGQQFGDWDVIDEAPRWFDNKVWRRTWNCLCICGERRVVTQANLRSGASRGCGCYRNELARERFAKSNEEKRLTAMRRRAKMEESGKHCSLRH